MYLSALRENYALAHRDRQYSVVGRHDITGGDGRRRSYVHEKVARPLGRVVVDGQVSPFDVADGFNQLLARQLIAAQGTLTT
jgi:hypothetical protein